MRTAQQRSQLFNGIDLGVPVSQSCSTCPLAVVSAASTGSRFHLLSRSTDFPQPSDSALSGAPSALRQGVCTYMRILTIFSICLHPFFRRTEEAALRIRCRPMGPAGSRLGRSQQDRGHKRACLEGNTGFRGPADAISWGQACASTGGAHTQTRLRRPRGRWAQRQVVGPHS